MSIRAGGERSPLPCQAEHLCTRVAGLLHQGIEPSQVVPIHPKRDHVGLRLPCPVPLHLVASLSSSRSFRATAANIKPDSSIARLIGSGFGYLWISTLDTFWSIGVAMFVLSIFVEAFRPAVMADVAERAPEGLQVRAFALLRLAANLGVGIGPAVGGYLALYSYRWLFVADDAPDFIHRGGMQTLRFKGSDSTASRSESLFLDRWVVQAATRCVATELAHENRQT